MRSLRIFVLLFAQDAHRAFTSTIRQILNSFVRILNTRSAIGSLAQPTAVCSTHVYEVRPRKDNRGVDLISDALPFGRLWYDGPNAVANAIGYAEHYSPFT